MPAAEKAMSNSMMDDVTGGLDSQVAGSQQTQGILGKAAQGGSKGAGGPNTGIGGSKAGQSMDTPSMQGASDGYNFVDAPSEHALKTGDYKPAQTGLLGKLGNAAGSVKDQIGETWGGMGDFQKGMLIQSGGQALSGLGAEQKQQELMDYKERKARERRERINNLTPEQIRRYGVIPDRKFRQVGPQKTLTNNSQGRR